MASRRSSSVESQRVNRHELEAFGFSQSSESDDPPRKSSSSKSKDQKKKKKKRPAPQQSINKIWRRFATKHSSKALAILPFDPVPLPSTPERPNELLNAGYERVREECSRKVKKIIQECRRVNMRYRDPGFDLHYDLRMGKGDCLNYLGSKKFDVADRTMGTSADVPKAVKRVHEIFEQPVFMKDLEGADVKQGTLGDCWFIAALTALASVEGGLERVCVEYDTRIGIYGFVFYRDGEWIYSIIDDKLYLTSPNWDSPSMQRKLLNQLDRDNPEREYRKTYQTGSKALFFGQCKDQNETWVPLLEKAYAKAHGDYGSLSGGWTGEGLEDLSGGVTTELLISDILDLDGFWENELSKVNQEFLFGCSTGRLDGGYGQRNGIREGHAYVVMDARTVKTGERLVKLRNPWGVNRKGLWKGPWSDGSKEWNGEVKEELNHEFGNDSVFWITYEDLREKFSRIDRTRLFRGDDWRCCQRWIGAEVPWKTQWNEKFQFKLTRESPVVLVLQQLDDRYYKGLEGQYTFRLHFRIHEQGKPDAEDYIVRSHGSYGMDRSTSIELPYMEPGNYSVWVSIVARRYTSIPSIEEVVKRECLNRVQNEKLAQVGYAYDLAHSKGVAHLEHVAKLRKKSDFQKASTYRMAERRKLWERRHIGREIDRKQKKKNEAKRDRRREAKALEKKEKKEAAEKAKEAEEAERKKTEEAEEAECKKREEEKPKDVAVQTDKKESNEDRGVQTEAGDENAKSSDITKEDATDEHPKTIKAETGPADDKTEDIEKKGEREAVDSARKPDGTTSKSRRERRRKKGAQPSSDSTAESSLSDSSDSPVEDWELIYSSDDMSKKPRIPTAPAQTTNDKDVAVESDGESKMPDPWNAVCIVGFRVYSKDEDLQLHVVVEGGELAEGGMGEKGAADIDNAQVNAGGAREEKDADKTPDEVQIIDGDVISKKANAHDDKKEEDTNTEADDADAEDDDESKPGEKRRKKKGKKKKPTSKSDSSDSESSPINTPDSTTDPSGDCNPQSMRTS